jgi:hypothetical protein
VWALCEIDLVSVELIVAHHVDSQRVYTAQSGVTGSPEDFHMLVTVAPHTEREALEAIGLYLKSTHLEDGIATRCSTLK